MKPEDIVAEMVERPWASVISVTAANDQCIEVAFHNSVGSVLDVNPLVTFMTEHNYELKYAIPENRKYQFIKS